MLITSVRYFSADNLIPVAAARLVLPTPPFPLNSRILMPTIIRLARLTYASQDLIRSRIRSQNDPFLRASTRGDLAGKASSRRPTFHILATRLRTFESTAHG